MRSAVARVEGNPALVRDRLTTPDAGGPGGLETTRDKMELQ